MYFEIADMVFWLLVGCLLSALFLKQAVKWVLKKRVSFGEAYVTALLPILIVAVIDRAMMYLPSSTFANFALVITCFMLFVCFLLQAVCIHFRINIPFFRACLVTLVMVGQYLVLGVLIGTIVSIVLPIILMCYGL